MAIFDPKNIPVISKLTIGEKTYYLKDAEARELLAKLGTEVQVVSGVTYDKATVNAADTKFTADEVELAVGDITVAAKEVTVQ